MGVGGLKKGTGHKNIAGRLALAMPLTYSKGRGGQKGEREC